MNVQKIDVKITNPTTGEIFFQKDQVEAPSSWSETAVTIAASKYFADGENSVFSMVGRVVRQIKLWGEEQGYFDNEEQALEFMEYLEELLLDQRAAFNTPVWLNIGVPSNKNQVAGCFIFNVEDNMSDILLQNTKRGETFKWGSGVGTNVSALRAEGELLSNKGKSSGPLSFMKIWDQTAGSVKSGGKSRRAASMVCMDIDHPDIEKFIECKSKEEEKANLLIAAGIDPKEALQTVAYQNSNHSVMVTNDFMRAVKEDAPWRLINRGDGLLARKIRAQDLFNQIAETAWATGDPGIQFRDTINEDNPVPSLGDIESSNPCFTGDMKLLTYQGYKTFEELSSSQGTLIITPEGKVTPSLIWCSGEKEIVQIKLDTPESANSLNTIRCTADHIFKTADGREVSAISLCGETLKAFYPISEKDPVVTEVEILSGLHKVYDFSEPNSNWGVVNGVVVHNCGEHLAINNSACNLSSLNLVKYIKEDGLFNYELFEKDVRHMIIAQDIMIDKADYPTEEAAKVASETRPIGLGFANLGASLMLQGLPYDSEQGRTEAAKITRAMTEYAYYTSTLLAKKLKSYTHFHENHSENLDIIDKLTNSTALLSAVKRYGLRNSQVTLLAPTGTISLIMDCDTSGIEPLFALKAHKALAGGGTLKMIPKCVITKLEELVNAPVDYGLIKEFINRKKEWKKLFATADKISPLAHLQMMAACQKHLSSGISKTINLPNDATVEDVKDIYMKAWELNVKSVTVYRDGSKNLQPLTNADKVKENKQQEIKEDCWMPYRRKLPRPALGMTQNFNLGGLEGYFTVNTYEDGTPGELFIKVKNHGSIMDGILDAFAKSISFALQYGIPLETLVEKYKGTKFDPAGVTGNEDVPMVDSIIDFIFKWIEIYYLDNEEDEEPTEEQDSQLVVRWEPKPKISFNGPLCTMCGSITSRSGTCFTCSSCGATTGCS
jgi:ribonucleotide reductase alpha subunit